MSKGILGYEQHDKFFGGRELSGKRGLVSTGGDTSVGVELDIKVCKLQS